MADSDYQSRDEVEEELASVRLDMAELEREKRLYRKLHFSTEMIEDHLRPLRRRQEQLTVALARLTEEGDAPANPRWAKVQRTPSPSN